MKSRITILVLFCATFIGAQNKIFQKNISVTEVSENQKISKGLADTYLSTTYYHQPSFNLTSELEITLPNSKTIKAKFQKEFSYSNKSESFVYTVRNEPASELVLSKVDGIVTGMYLSGEGEKIIFHQTDAQTFAVSVVNESVLIKKDVKLDLDLDEATNTKIAHSNICLASTPVCPSTVIDVMVVFTPQAKTAWGGVAQSKSFIATAITNFNTALVSSGVSNVTINLVYAEEIAYVESGVIGTDLSRLRTAGDTYLDEVQALRVSYGADLCALVTSTPSGTCGLGYLNTNPTNYSAEAAYTVSLYNCVVSNYTLAHEMGHNMGLNHDWYVNQSMNPCEHQHGYTNKTAITLGPVSTATQRWRTIMAYNDECSAKGFNCTRVNRWANPGAIYNTEITGVPIGESNPADEAFGFARFACVVAEFMPTITLGASESKIASLEDFSIYPVPAKDELNIRIKKDGKYTFKVTSLSGQLVLTSGQKTLNLKGLSPGTYILSIYSNSNDLIGTKKFIIE